MMWEPLIKIEPVWINFLQNIVGKILLNIVGIFLSQVEDFFFEITCLGCYYQFILYGGRKRC